MHNGEIVNELCKGWLALPIIGKVRQQLLLMNIAVTTKTIATGYLSNNVYQLIKYVNVTPRILIALVKIVIEKIIM